MAVKIYIKYEGNNIWKIFTEKTTLLTFHNTSKINAIEFAKNYITSWQGAILEVIE